MSQGVQIALATVGGQLARRGAASIYRVDGDITSGSGLWLTRMRDVYGVNVSLYDNATALLEEAAAELDVGLALYDSATPESTNAALCLCAGASRGEGEQALVAVAADDAAAVAAVGGVSYRVAIKLLEDAFHGVFLHILCIPRRVL